MYSSKKHYTSNCLACIDAVFRSIVTDKCAGECDGELATFGYKWHFVGNNEFVLGARIALSTLRLMVIEVLSLGYSTVPLVALLSRAAV
jgi:hypothetical protein